MFSHCFVFLKRQRRKPLRNPDIYSLIHRLPLRPECLSKCRRFLLPLSPTSILSLRHIYSSAVLSVFKLSSLTLLCVSPPPPQHFGARSRRANCPPRFRCSRYPFQQVRLHPPTHNNQESKHTKLPSEPDLVWEILFINYLCFLVVGAAAVTASAVDLHSAVQKNVGSRYNVNGRQ